MPIYEYACTRCGHQFEKIQKFSDRPIRTCPECKGRVEKLVSQSAFVLKGGGWYADGYGGGRKNVTPSSTSSSSSTSKSDSSSKTKSSSKAKKAS